MRAANQTATTYDLAERWKAVLRELQESRHQVNALMQENLQLSRSVQYWRAWCEQWVNYATRLQVDRLNAGLGRMASPTVPMAMGSRNTNGGGQPTTRQ